MLAAVGWAMCPVAFGADALLFGVLAVACFLMGVAWGFGYEKKDRPFALDKIVPIKRKTEEEKESKEEIESNRKIALAGQNNITK